MDFLYFLLCDSVIRSLSDAFVFFCLVLGRCKVGLLIFVCGFVSFVQVHIFNSMACLFLCVSIFENINQTNDAF